MRLSVLALVVSTIAVLPACSSTGPERLVALEASVDRKTVNVKPWEAQIGWMSRERGGAAYRQAGYVHVLTTGVATGKPIISESQVPDSDLTPKDGLSDGRISEMLARLKQMEAGSNITAAEVGAVGVTKERPAAVASVGSRQPNALVHHPDLNERQHDAWKRYCEGRAGMSGEDWSIIAATSGPTWYALEHYRRQGCAALRNDFIAAQERAVQTKRAVGDETVQMGTPAPRTPTVESSGLTQSAEQLSRPSGNPDARGAPVRLYPAAAGKPPSDCPPEQMKASGQEPGCAVR